MKQEEKEEVKRAFDGAGLSPEERVSGAKHKARRWLGQHFLIDHSVLIDAVRSADVKKEDVILEIGPGTEISLRSCYGPGVKSSQ